jgi:hypothetical protein
LAEAAAINIRIFLFFPSQKNVEEEEEEEEGGEKWIQGRCSSVDVDHTAGQQPRLNKTPFLYILYLIFLSKIMAS